MQNEFSAQVKDLVMQNVQDIGKRLNENFDIEDVKATAVRYARQYPVLTVVGTTAIGLAAGLLCVSALSGDTKQS